MQIVCQRKFIKASTNRPVEFKIGLPEQASGEGIWETRIEISGLSREPIIKIIKGVDSFQSLEHAMSVVCQLLEDSEQDLIWDGVTAGDTGLPLMFSWSFDYPMKTETRKLVNSLIAKRLASRS